MSRFLPVVDRTLGALLLLVAVGWTPAPVRAQEPVSEGVAESDPWMPYRLLEGSWRGEIAGRLGTGEALRRYELRADGRYLERRHASVRLPQEESPEGDYHRALGVFSYDRNRRAMVLREFMVEGVVVRSACEAEAMRFVCTSEQVENGEGIHARLTIDMASRYRFTETYELQFPGQEMKLYFTNQWTRIPDLQD